MGGNADTISALPPIYVLVITDNTTADLDSNGFYLVYDDPSTDVIN